MSDDDIDVRLEWPGGSPSADPDLVRPRRAEADDEAVDPVDPAEVPAPAPAPARSPTAMLAAYDRLGSRVLEGLRALREDVDAELAALRSEVGDLRHAVDDIGDRVQVRALRASIEQELGAIRSSTEQQLAALRAAIEEHAALVDMTPLADEVAALRQEMVALRRRITLRVDSEELDDTRLERLATLLSERLGDRPARGRGR